MMVEILVLLLVIGVLPLAGGAFLIKPAAQGERSSLRVLCSSTLLCALSFNLTFFWQELWLVLPKAMTPGLHPILYHNDHDWTGSSPVTELLQGTGAVATLVSGVACLGGLRIARSSSTTGRLFLFWMAFQGVYQSLTQLAFGTLLPGNDVGRALAYLHAGGIAKAILLAVAVAAMAVMGGVLARAWPGSGDRVADPRTRAFLLATLIPAVASIMLIIPFRLPRNIIEVGLIPIAVHLAGIGWLILGAALIRSPSPIVPGEPPRILLPALMLAAALLLFQLVLRPGIAF